MNRVKFLELTMGDIQQLYHICHIFYPAGKIKVPHLLRCQGFAVRMMYSCTLGRLGCAASEALRFNPFFELQTYGTVFRNAADRVAIIEGLRKAGLK